MIVVDGSALTAYLAGTDERAEEELAAAAGETWVCSPLALAEVLAPVVASPEMLARAQHILAEIGVIEVDLISHAGVILARLLGESGVSLAGAGTLQLALERDATVLALDPALRTACTARGLRVLPDE